MTAPGGIPARAPLALPRAIAEALRAVGLPIVVVGGGGWLGLATLELLAGALGETFASRVRVFGSRERRLRLWAGTEIECLPLPALSRLPAQPSLIFHFGFLTRDRVGAMAPQAYLEANRAIAETVAAAALRLPAAGMVVPSSGAVYARDGGIETDCAANPYGFLKAEDERRFTRLAERLASRLVMPRVFNLSGPYINKLESYAIASILAAILRDQPVVLRAERPVLRSYVHVADLLTLCMALLLDGKAPPPGTFDTAGAEVVEVGELARRACEQLGRAVDIRRPALADGAVSDRYVGDGARMAQLAQAAGVPLLPLDGQLLSTAADLAPRLHAPS